MASPSVGTKAAALNPVRARCLLRKLYGLNRNELCYILDPQDVWPDYPGETFRVLKDKEIRQYGEYRTRRLALEAWDRLEGVDVGNPDAYPAQVATDPPKQERFQ